MKIQTSKLKDMQLDWAVEKCIRLVSDPEFNCDDVEIFLSEWPAGGHRYSTDWSLCGPILEKDLICLEERKKMGGWLAYLKDEDTGHSCLMAFGPTPLIAAMRCYVTSKLGPEIEIPEELV